MIRDGRLGIPHQLPAAPDLQILPPSLLRVFDCFGGENLIRRRIIRNWRAKICERKGDSTFASKPALHLHDRQHRHDATPTFRDKTYWPVTVGVANNPEPGARVEWNAVRASGYHFVVCGVLKRIEHFNAQSSRQFTSCSTIACALQRVHRLDSTDGGSLIQTVISTLLNSKHRTNSPERGFRLSHA